MNEVAAASRRGRPLRAGGEAALGSWTLRAPDTDGRRILGVPAVRAS